MASRSFVPVLVLATLLLGEPSASAQSIPEPVVVVRGLDFPVGLEFLDEETMLVTERGGALRVVRGGQLQKEPLARIPTTTTGETGLLDLAIAPDRDSVFLFATEADGASNTIWRVSLDPPGRAERVIEGLPAATYHNGGGVAFDDEGYLFVSNGEQHSTDRAQDPSALGGKIYRFDQDGGIPDDNPYSGSPTFAFGLRNPFGLTVDPQTGDPWVTENGPSSFDEVDRIVPDGNYGWPVVSGPGDGSGLPGRYQNPVLSYEQIVVPTGIAFAGEGAAPGIEGDLFFGTFGEATIHHVTLDRDRTAAASDRVIHRGDPVIGMTWGPLGLYFTTPGAVKVIELVSETEDPTPSAEPSASLDPTPVPPDDGQDGGSRGSRAGSAIAIAVGLLLGGTFLVLRRRMGTG